MAGLYDKEKTYQFPMGPKINKTITIHQSWGKNGTGVGGAVWPTAEVLCRLLCKYKTPGEVLMNIKTQCSGIGDTGLSSPISNNIATTDTIPSTTAEGSNKLNLEWKDLKTFELGAGVGLLSVVLDCVLGCRSLIITEGEENALPIIRKNLDININKEKSELTNTPTVKQLRWGNTADLRQIMLSSLQLKNSKNYPSLDLIIGSDLVYGEASENWDSLVETLVYLCGRQQNSITQKECKNPLVLEHQPLIFLAQAERYASEKYSLFFDKMKASGFEMVARINMLDALKKKDTIQDIPQVTDWKTNSEENINKLELDEYFMLYIFR